MVIKASLDSFELTTERVAEARAADRLAKERYQRGVESLLTVLETERRLRLAEQAIITNTGNVWNSRIDLFLALGGDWGTDPESEHPETTPEAESSSEDDDRTARADSETQNSKLKTQNSEEVS
ncbi:MAG: TolC family protein [Candidatus Sulfomarinibacteraceae bacterium]